MKIKLTDEMIEAITIRDLKLSLKMCKEDVKAAKKGGWIHPADLEASLELIPALKRVLAFYGG
jgi:hypothetical protein